MEKGREKNRRSGYNNIASHLKVFTFMVDNQYVYGGWGIIK